MYSAPNIDFAILATLALLTVLVTIVAAYVLVMKYRRAREEMRITKEFFQSTFDSAAVGMAVADISGRYVKVNRAMCDFVQYSEAELLAMSFHDITFPEDLPENLLGRRRLLAGEVPTFQMEKRYVRKDGQVVWAMMVVSQIQDKNGKVIYSVGQMVDIDAQKRIEQSLRASKESLANAQRVARIGDWEWNICDNTVTWSEALGHILGVEPAKFPKDYEAFLSWALPEDRPFVQGIIGNALKNLEPFAIDGRMAHSDGRHRFMSMRGEVVLDDFGKPSFMRGTLQDISERKQIELALIESRRQLRELSTHQKSIIEDERKRIAREVHDELGQRLTALKMDISLLRMRFGRDPLLYQRLEEMRKLADGTIDVVRHIASDLRPAALDLGVVSAIQWLAEDLELRSDICCRLDLLNEDVPMSDTQATAVFRVVQESLTNVMRHAQASEVLITLKDDNGRLHLQVRDDGCGFQSIEAGQSLGFGLLGMRERVLGLGGTMQIESSEGQGTTVSIEFPLAREALN